MLEVAGTKAIVQVCARMTGVNSQSLCYLTRTYFPENTLLRAVHPGCLSWEAPLFPGNPLSNRP